MKSRAILREKAKKAYKEQIKGVPKKQRVPFAQFFKQFKDDKAGKADTQVEAEETDFDFDNIINVNEISDENPEEKLINKEL